MYKLKLKYIEYDEKLSPKERRTLEHNIAYSLLDDMLKEHLGPISFTVLKNENGKPYVNLEGVHFSLSHTNGLAVCAIADKPIGIDCEQIVAKSKEDIQKFAKRFFVENEICFLENGGFSPFDFFKVWTGKEATIKKRGSNMSEIKKIDTTKESLIFSYEKEYIICINV